MSGFSRYSNYTNVSSVQQDWRRVPDSSSLFLQTHLPLSSLLLWVFGPGACTCGFRSEPFPSIKFSALRTYLPQVTALSSCLPGLGR